MSQCLPVWKRSRSLFFGLLACLLQLGIPVRCVRAQPLDVLEAWQQRIHTAIDRAAPAVVSVARIRRGVPRRVREEQFDPFGRMIDPTLRVDRSDPSHPEFIPNSFGTGIVFQPDHAPRQRLILTMYHVVRGGRVRGRTELGRDRIFIQFSNKDGCDAEIIAADPRCDLAVLALLPGQSGLEVEKLPHLTIPRAGQYRKGDLVLMLGNPYAIARDGSASVCRGMISNVSRRPAPLSDIKDETERRLETIHHYGTLLQLDARINLGSSGGAVLNLKGELIGITTSMAALEGVERSAGFAIPFDASLRRIVNDLAKGYEVEFGMLGVEPRTISPANMKRFGGATQQRSAAEVLKVFPESPADRAGIRARDVILSVNGEAVYSHFDLMREVGELQPLQRARIRLLRQRANAAIPQTLDVEVLLGKRPVYAFKDHVVTASRLGPYTLGRYKGLVVDFPTARREFLVGPVYRRAVVITKLDSTNPDATQLREGDFISHVNGVPVSNPRQFDLAIKKVLEDAARGDVRSVRLTLPNRTETIELPAS